MHGARMLRFVTLLTSSPSSSLTSAMKLLSRLTILAHACNTRPMPRQFCKPATRLLMPAHIDALVNHMPPVSVKELRAQTDFPHPFHT